MDNHEHLRLLNVEEIAALLHLSPASVRRHFARKEIPGRKIGKRWYCSHIALQKWMEGGQP